MFCTLFSSKKNKQTEKVAHALYKSALSSTRKPVFYKCFGVPDTFDGRFDLLLVHIFVILHRIRAVDSNNKISQAVFDSVFRDMDQTLREMGIGDMGIPKHMKRMMTAFNGRMHIYQLACDPDSLSDEIEVERLSLHDALLRNLYGTLEDVDHQNLDDMAAFIRDNISQNDTHIIDEILNGNVAFLINEKEQVKHG